MTQPDARDLAFGSRRCRETSPFSGEVCQLGRAHGHQHWAGGGDRWDVAFPSGDPPWLRYGSEPSGFGQINNPNAIRRKRANKAKRSRREMVRDSRRRNRA